MSTRERTSGRHTALVPESETRKGRHGLTAHAPGTAATTTVKVDPISQAREVYRTDGQGTQEYHFYYNSDKDPRVAATAAQRRGDGATPFFHQQCAVYAYSSSAPPPPLLAGAMRGDDGRRSGHGNARTRSVVEEDPHHSRAGRALDNDDEVCTRPPIVEEPDEDDGGAPMHEDDHRAAKGGGGARRPAGQRMAPREHPDDGDGRTMMPFSFAMQDPMARHMTALHSGGFPFHTFPVMAPPFHRTVPDDRWTNDDALMMDPFAEMDAMMRWQRAQFMGMHGGHYY